MNKFLYKMVSRTCGRDTDGQGSILENGQTLGGKMQGTGNAYTGTDSAGATHSYAILGGDITAAGGATLLIDGNIKVLNYRQGDLGITLGDATPKPPAPSIINGDLTLIQFGLTLAATPSTTTTHWATASPTAPLRLWTTSSMAQPATTTSSAAAGATMSMATAATT